MGAVPSNTTVVVVDLAPTGAACPPRLVSFTAVHAGAFAHVDANVSVQVATPVPVVTLPAESDPTMLAPALQSTPSVGATATDVPGQSSRTAPMTRRARPDGREGNISNGAMIGRSVTF